MKFSKLPFDLFGIVSPGLVEAFVDDFVDVGERGDWLDVFDGVDLEDCVVVVEPVPLVDCVVITGMVTVESMIHSGVNVISSIAKKPSLLAPNMPSIKSFHFLSSFIENCFKIISKLREM